MPIFSVTFWRGVLGKENAEERVEGKAKVQRSTKGEEKTNEREKEDEGKPDLQSVFDLVDPPRVRVWRCR